MFQMISNESMAFPSFSIMHMWSQVVIPLQQGNWWFLLALVDWSNLPATEDGKKLLNAKNLDTFKYIYVLKAVPYHKLNIQ